MKRKKACVVCPGEDLNLHGLRHTHLKRTCIPVSPPGHDQYYKSSSYFLDDFLCSGADERTRTSKGLLPYAPEAYASTNFATSACCNLTVVVPTPPLAGRTDLPHRLRQLLYHVLGQLGDRPS